MRHPSATRRRGRRRRHPWGRGGPALRRGGASPRRRRACRREPRADPPGAPPSRDALHVDGDLPAAGQPHLPRHLVGDAVGEAPPLPCADDLGGRHHDGVLHTAAETEPQNSPFSLTAMWLPASRGAEPQVRTTVASATPSPWARQSAALDRTSRSVLVAFRGGSCVVYLRGSAELHSGHGVRRRPLPGPRTASIPGSRRRARLRTRRSGSDCCSLLPRSPAARAHGPQAE